jgi:hypothetical protein
LITQPIRSNADNRRLALTAGQLPLRAPPLIWITHPPAFQPAQSFQFNLKKMGPANVASNSGFRQSGSVRKRRGLARMLRLALSMSFMVRTAP